MTELKMTIGRIEYIDSRFLAGCCASRQIQVADGANEYVHLYSAS